MSSDDAGSPAYTTVIDLTGKAQQAARQERIVSSFSEPDPALPELTVDLLPPLVRHAVDTAGWTDLMPVQKKAMPYMLDGRDLIVQSRTGSGKTGAFLLPLFEMLDPEKAFTQALILCPTRELARQIHEEFQKMTGSDSALRAALVYGGVRYKTQINALREGAHVVIGTPGRILDHLYRKSFSLQNLAVLVFDEADEMLSMGFMPAMKEMRRFLPKDRKSYMFSATIPPRVRSLARDFLDEPGFLSLSVGQVSVDAIDHRYYIVDPMEKDRILVRLFEMENPDSAIIFVNTKRDVGYLAQFLKNYGYDASEISGDLDQRAREQVMDRIRRGDLRFLVATDVAARGIDISDLSHVFMYDVPQDQEYFVHRAGRTARAGKTGKSLVLASAAEKNLLLRITRKFGIDIEEHNIPTPEEVEGRTAERATVLLEKLFREKTNLDKERLQKFVPLVEQLSAEEPEILAMLVDNLYQRQRAAPLESEDREDTKNANQRNSSSRSASSRKKPSSRKKRGGDSRRSSRR